MKYSLSERAFQALRSLPVRGAWVEMLFAFFPFALRLGSLPVRGAWVEIQRLQCKADKSARRSPCGERGLKFYHIMICGFYFFVAPRAGSVG